MNRLEVFEQEFHQSGTVLRSCLRSGAAHEEATRAETLLGLSDAMSSAIRDQRPMEAEKLADALGESGSFFRSVDAGATVLTALLRGLPPVHEGATFLRLDAYASQYNRLYVEARLRTPDQPQPLALRYAQMTHGRDSVLLFCRNSRQWDEGYSLYNAQELAERWGPHPRTARQFRVQGQVLGMCDLLRLAMELSPVPVHVGLWPVLRDGVMRFESSRDRAAAALEERVSKAGLAREKADAALQAHLVEHWQGADRFAVEAVFNQLTSGDLAQAKPVFEQRLGFKPRVEPMRTFRELQHQWRDACNQYTSLASLVDEWNARIAQEGGQVAVAQTGS